MSKCAAGIVLYNPEINRLKLNIDAICVQVKVVYCFNNGSDNSNEIYRLLQNYTNVYLIDENKNLGIATALNRMTERASKDGMEWLLTLDQDSICASNMIEEFNKYTNKKNIGIICPLSKDKRRPQEKVPLSDTVISEIDYCITSGSLININICNTIGGFDDYLFIDSVDNDYCYRIRKNNYKIIRFNHIILDHELGDLTPSKGAKFYLKLGTIFKSKRIKALSYKRKVLPMRAYYQTRNIVYLSKKHGSPIYKFSVKFALYNGASDILRSQNKVAVAKAVMKGFKDGLHKQ